MDDKIIYSYIDEIGNRFGDPGLYGAASLMIGAGFSKNADCVGTKKIHLQIGHNFPRKCMMNYICLKKIIRKRGEAVMGLLYAIFSIFITLFFPKQIANVICYGRHRDRVNIKSKKIYCLIYVFWTLFFGLICLMMGSASGVNNTFDRVLDYYGLNFGEYDYFEAASIYDEHDYKHEGDFTLVYYIRKNEDNLDDLIKQIVQENNSIYKRYQLSEIDVVYETKGIYYIYEKGEVVAKVVVENDGLLKKVSYQWSREKLEQNLGG